MDDVGSAGREYRNEVVRIVDLAVTSEIIEGVTFTNCSLIGPAVLVPVGDTTISHCEFPSDIDAFLWPVERPRVIGGIALLDCVLTQCKFDMLGLAAAPDMIAQIRAELNPLDQE